MLWQTLASLLKGCLIGHDAVQRAAREILYRALIVQKVRYVDGGQQRRQMIRSVRLAARTWVQFRVAIVTRYLGLSKWHWQRRCWNVTTLRCHSQRAIAVAT